MPPWGNATPLPTVCNVPAMNSRPFALTITAAVALGVAGSASAAPQNLKKTVSTKDSGKTSWSVWDYCTVKEARDAKSMAQSGCLKNKGWSRKTSGTVEITTNTTDFLDAPSSVVVFRRGGARAVLDISYLTKKSKSAKLKTSLPVKKRVLSNVSATRTSTKDWESSNTSCRWSGDTLLCGRDDYEDATWKITVKDNAPRTLIRAAEAPQPAGRWWNPTEGGTWVGSVDLLPTYYIAGDTPEVDCEGVTQKVKLQQGKWKATKTLKGIRGECVAL